MELTVLVNQSGLFKEVLTEVFDILYSYSYEKLMNKERAQAVLHAAILTAYDNVKPFMDTKHVMRYWIIRVVKKYIEYEQKMHPTYKKTGNTVISICQVAAVEEDSTLQPLFEQYLDKISKDIIGAMKERHQIILQKHYMEGLPLERIADEFGISIREVKKQDQLAKLIFQKKLFTYIW